jgi:hypothetical protein
MYAEQRVTAQDRFSLFLPKEVPSHHTNASPICLRLRLSGIGLLTIKCLHVYLHMLNRLFL